jgi:hypothetical protein
MIPAPKTNRSVITFPTHGDQFPMPIMGKDLPGLYVGTEKITSVGFGSIPPSP